MWFCWNKHCFTFSKKKYKIHCLDNLSRKGSKYNLELLKKNYIKNYNFNINNQKEIKKLPKYNLIIDCCAEAAVEISKKKIDKVINTNLIGTINILKKAKNDKSKIIFLSSSRVYPIDQLSNIIKNKKISKKIFLLKNNKRSTTYKRSKIYLWTNKVCI